MKARFDVLVNSAERVVIRCRANIEGCRSVTNDAVAVVAHLRSEGMLTPGKRLWYYDSQGDLDEIVWSEDGDVDFRPGPGFWTNDEGEPHAFF